MLKNDSSSTWRAHPWAFAAATLLMLVILNYLHEVLSRFAAYRSLYKNHAFYVPEGIDKIGGIVLCALAVWGLRRGALEGIISPNQESTRPNSTTRQNPDSLLCF